MGPGPGLYATHHAERLANRSRAIPRNIGLGHCLLPNYYTIEWLNIPTTAGTLMPNAKKQRIVVIGNTDKPQTLELGRNLLDFLGPRVEVVGNNIFEKLDLQNLPPADYAVVLGGDGTILSTARAMRCRQIPVIGVNIGKLGFLAEFSVDEFRHCFDQIVSDTSLITQRLMLRCEVHGPNRPEALVNTAINELAIVAGPPFRMIEVSIAIGDEHLAVTAGDGLIVATPTGSTAYNLSAGGPILMATLPAAVLTPLAAHSLSFRPVVVDLDKPLVLRRHNGHAATRRHGEAAAGPHGGAVIVTIDGQVTIPLKQEDQVRITQAPEPFRLVCNPQQGQWRLLNAKLNWGALPNYQRPIG